MGLTDRGCSYAVRINANARQAARARLQEVGLQPMRVFYDGGDGAFSEATL
jgi:hypothetical protein